MTELEIAYAVTVIFNVIILIMLGFTDPLYKVKSKVDKSGSEDDEFLKNIVYDQSLSEKEMKYFKNRSSQGVAFYGAIVTLSTLIELVCLIQWIFPMEEAIIYKIIYIVIIVIYVSVAVVIINNKRKIFEDNDKFKKRIGKVLKKKKIRLPSRYGIVSYAYFLKVRVEDFEGRTIACKFQVAYDMYQQTDGLCYVVFYNNRVVNVCPFHSVYIE